MPALPVSLQAPVLLCLLVGSCCLPAQAGGSRPGSCGPTAGGSGAEVPASAAPSLGSEAAGSGWNRAASSPWEAGLASGERTPSRNCPFPCAKCDLMNQARAEAARRQLAWIASVTNRPGQAPAQTTGKRSAPEAAPEDVRPTRLAWSGAASSLPPGLPVWPSDLLLPPCVEAEPIPAQEIRSRGSRALVALAFRGTALDQLEGQPHWDALEAALAEGRRADAQASLEALQAVAALLEQRPTGL